MKHTLRILLLLLCAGMAARAQDACSAGHDHAAHAAEETDEHEGHDHDAEPHAEEAVDPHAGHNHGSETACSGESVEVAVEKDVSSELGFKIDIAGPGDIVLSSTMPATVQVPPHASVAVSARLSGLVTELLKEVGDTVEKGEVVATMESDVDLRTLELKAPAAGEIVRQEARLGDAVSAGSRIFEIRRNVPMWAEIQLNPRWDDQVKTGMSIYLTALNNHCQHKGVVVRTGQEVDPKTRRSVARVTIDCGDLHCQPGAVLKAEMPVSKHRANVRVPLAAVQDLKGQMVVFTPSFAGFKPREVVVGKSDREFIEIRSGLGAGEMYISRGAGKLKRSILISGIDPHAGHGH